MLHILYKCLWLLIHLVAQLVDFCSVTATFLQSHLQYLFTNAFHTSADSANDDKRAIEWSKKHLTKIPSHVTLILGDNSPSDETISRLICWASTVGVRRISLYDYKGKQTHQNTAICMFRHRIYLLQ